MTKDTFGPDMNGRVQSVPERFSCEPLPLAAIQAAPVAVVGLEWEVLPANKDGCEPRTHYGYWVGGYYHVATTGVRHWSVGTFDNKGRAKHVGYYDTLAEAKAAAQADYETRILSALSPTLAVPGDVPGALRIPNLNTEISAETKSALDDIDAALRQGAMLAKGALGVVGGWRYSINYGPDGEENYANLTTPTGEHVANIRTHHAMAIVAGLNAVPLPTGNVGEAVTPSYAQIIAIVKDCVERMKQTGESYLMLAKWISEGVNAAARPKPVADTGVVEALRKIIGMDSHIDATPRGERKVVYGPMASIAAAALVAASQRSGE